MCVIAWHWTPDQDLMLTLWANRDEWLNRPSLALAPWTERPEWVGGRDLKAGGAWLLIDHQRGRLAGLTNMRNQAPEADGVPIRPSRGEIPVLALSDERFLQTTDRFHGYAGFNLVMFSRDQASALSIASGVSKPICIKAGIGSVSNGHPGDRWPKQKRLEQAIKHAQALGDSLWIEAAWNALSDQSIPSDCELPDTGLSLERERELAPVFINTKTYGTRQSTVLKLWSDGVIQLWERTWTGHCETLKYQDIFWSTERI